MSFPFLDGVFSQNNLKLLNLEKLDNFLRKSIDQKNTLSTFQKLFVKHGEKNMPAVL